MFEAIYDYFTTPTYLRKVREHESFAYKIHRIFPSKNKHIEIYLSVCKNLMVTEYHGEKSKYILYDSKVMNFEVENNTLTYIKYGKKHVLHLFDVDGYYFFRFETIPKWMRTISSWEESLKCPANTPHFIIPNENPEKNSFRSLTETKDG